MKATLIKTGNEYLLRDSNGGVLAITQGSVRGKKLSHKNCDEIFEAVRTENLAEDLKEVSVGIEMEQDYSNRSCNTCNLFNDNNGGDSRTCELNLQSKCASFAGDETLGDYWISNHDDEHDHEILKVKLDKDGCLILDQLLIQLKSKEAFKKCAEKYKNKSTLGWKMYMWDWFKENTCYMPSKDCFISLERAIELIEIY